MAFQIFMDAIGMSIGLAGASFNDNEGYTIFAGTFYKLNTTNSGGYITVKSKTFAYPVQGIMGWFGTSNINIDGIDRVLSSASENFTNNIALNPKFITPGVKYTAHMEETTTDSFGLKIEYIPGSTSSIDVDVYISRNYYAAICCYFYIFF